MNRWHLYRIGAGPDGTLGILGPEGSLGPFSTLEEEDQQNRSNISRIPAATYICKRSRYHKGGYDTFEITGVPNRQRILFHIGNTEEDVSGCVAVGMKHGLVLTKDEDTAARRPKAAVLSSKQAFGLFMERFNNVSEFELVIHDPGY